MNVAQLKGIVRVALALARGKVSTFE
jgi:hypothetical protein